jgi:hypothetical protein
MIRAHLLLLTGVIVLALCTSAVAQPLWVDRTDSPSVSLEFLRPNLDGDADLAALSAVWTLSGRTRVNDVWSFVGAVPYSHFDIENAQASTSIGNIYVGAEAHHPDADIFAEIGLRLPTAQEDEAGALAAGQLTDLVDRMEAFVSDAVPVTLAFNYRRQDEAGFISRVRAGMSLWAPVGDRDDEEAFLVYGGQVGYSPASVRVLAGVTGRWILTEDTDGIAEATFHQLGVTGGPSFGRFHPALHLRMPLDEDLLDVVDFVWGLSVTVSEGGDGA